MHAQIQKNVVRGGPILTTFLDECREEDPNTTECWLVDNGLTLNAGLIAL